MPDSKSNEARLTRLEQLGDDHLLLNMPDIGDGEYYIMLANQLGLATQNGNGLSAVSWQEIDAFNRLTDNDLDSFDADVLMSLSRHYVASYNRSRDDKAPPPYKHYDPELEAIQVKKDIAAMKAAIRGSVSTKAPK